MYADFNELTLRVTLEALFGFESPHATPTLSSGISAAAATTASSFSNGAGAAAAIAIAASTRDTTTYASMGGGGSSSAATAVAPAQPLAAFTPSDRNANAMAAADAAEEIVGAVGRAFEFFTRRAGSAFVLPEWVPTLDNLEFAASVQQLDRVRTGRYAGK